MKIEKGKQLICTKEFKIMLAGKKEPYSVIQKGQVLPITEVDAKGVLLGYSEIHISIDNINKYFQGHEPEAIPNDYKLKIFKDPNLGIELSVLKEGLLQSIAKGSVSLESSIDMKRKGVQLLTLSIYIKDSEIEIVGI